MARVNSDMRKKVVLVGIIWLVIAITVSTLFILREVSPVKELIVWALNLWPIIVGLFGAAFVISTLIVKHNFGKSTKQRSELTTGIEAEGSFINAPGARIKNQDISIKSKKSVINIPNSEITDERTK